MDAIFTGKGLSIFNNNNENSIISECYTLFKCITLVNYHFYGLIYKVLFNRVLTYFHLFTTNNLGLHKRISCPAKDQHLSKRIK